MPSLTPAVNAFRLMQRVSTPLAAEAAYSLWLSTGKRKRVHPLERAVIEQATTSTIRVGRSRIAVYTWGTGSRPVLLAHGLQGRAAEFAEIVRELRAQDLTIIAFDAPGHGASSGRKPDIRDFADIIDVLGRKYGTFEAIVAHSFGTAAAALAIRNGTRAHRLVSIGGVAELDYLASSFGRMLELSPHTIAGLRRRIEQRRFRTVPDVWTALSPITAPLGRPLLVIHDRDDLTVSFDQAEVLVAAHPHAATLFTSGLGHHRVLRDDQVLDAIGEFVSEPLSATVATTAH
ncbi:alpha/beta fold hydrolase [Homoserinimonas sp. A447]